MIRSIGFKNFRNFKEFPLMPLENLNILVGKNNAGKSTITKALRLILNKEGGLLSFLENMNSNFSFGADDTHIGNFSRALCRESTERKIRFEFETESFHVLFEVEESYNRTDGRITRVWVTWPELFFGIDLYRTDEQTNIYFMFDPYYEFPNLPKNVSELAKAYDYDKYNTLYNNDKYEQYEFNEFVEDNLSSLCDSSVEATEKNIRTSDVPIAFKSNFEGVDSIKALLYAMTKSLDEGDVNIQTTTRLLHDMVEWMMHSLKNELLYTKVVFKGAHMAIQSVALMKENKNDYAAQLVSDFLESETEEDSKGRKFVREWMTSFDLGENFLIRREAGEIFWVEIINNGGKRYLADIGVGGIQIFLLLLKIGTILNKYSSIFIDVDQDSFTISYDKYLQSCLRENYLLIVEEPEQNLHPRFQSMLFDLFHKLSLIGIQVIVETHSEYLVERSQVVVGDMFEKNPELTTDDIHFRVFYIDGSQAYPYRQIPYDRTGRFTEEFGSGFFDESSKHALAIISRK